MGSVQDYMGRLRADEEKFTFLAKMVCGHVWFLTAQGLITDNAESVLLRRIKDMIDVFKDMADDYRDVCCQLHSYEYKKDKNATSE